jgi:hypothetical protein
MQMTEILINNTMRKFLKYSCWTIAGVIAVMALCGNTCHLATASIFFILGTFQNEEDKQ